MALSAIAAQLPGRVQRASTEQRLRRWLKNRAVVVETLWTMLLPPLLASRAGQEGIVVLDPTPATARFVIVQLGILCRHRVLPIAWRMLPQQERWPEGQHQVIRALVQQAAMARLCRCGNWFPAAPRPGSSPSPYSKEMAGALAG